MRRLRRRRTARDRGIKATTEWRRERQTMLHRETRLDPVDDIHDVDPAEPVELIPRRLADLAVEPLALACRKQVLGSVHMEERVIFVRLDGRGRDRENRLGIDRWLGLDRWRLRGRPGRLVGLELHEASLE